MYARITSDAMLKRQNISSDSSRDLKTIIRDSVEATKYMGYLYEESTWEPKAP